MKTTTFAGGIQGAVYVCAVYASLSLGAATDEVEVVVHRWVDADGVTHFSDTRPQQVVGYETETLTIQTSEATQPTESREQADRRPTQTTRAVSRSRSGDAEAAARLARCAAWQEEFRTIRERRRRGNTAAVSARLRERSAELMRLRQRDC